MKKNRISKNWINKQRRDIYVRKSQIDGYRARSAYKLIEINEKFKIFKNGISVIDLGAAPGSWSQYTSRIVKNGRLVSIDDNVMILENRKGNQTINENEIYDVKVRKFSILKTITGLGSSYVFIGIGALALLSLSGFP